MVLHAHETTRGSPPRGGGRSPHLGGRGRRLAAAALLCALLAAVTVAVEPPGQPAGAASSDQSGGSSGSPAAPTTSAAAPTTSAASEAASVGSLSTLRATLDVGSGSVSVGWVTPGDDAVSKYQYQIKTMGAGGDYGDWTDIPGSGASTVSHEIRVTGSERRNVRVQAVNAAGDSIYYGVTSTDVPNAPSMLRALLDGDSVSLSWNDPGDDSIDSYWYRIKKAGPGNTYSTLIEIDGSGASTTSATINVTGEGRRIVELQARLATHPGWGATYKSAAVSTGRPARPSGLHIPGGSSGGDSYWPWVEAPVGSPKGEVDLRWSDPEDASIVKYQYRIRPARQGTVWSQYIDIPDSGASTTGYKFVLPTPEDYRFRMRAVNSKGAATMAVTLKTTSWPAPTAPSGLEASLNGSSLSLSWDNPFDGSIGKYEYQVKAVGPRTSWPGEWTEIDISGQNQNDPTFSVPINNVAGSGQRNVRLRVKGDNPAAIVSTDRPARPRNLRIKNGSSGGDSYWPWVEAPASSPKGEVNLLWDDPGDASIVKYQYRIRRARQGTVWSQYIDIPDSGASTTGYKFVLPTPEDYRFRMRAVNSKGAATMAVTLKTTSWPAPTAPSGLEASLNGSSLSLSWDNPFDGSIGKYEYQVKAVGPRTSWPGEWTEIDISGQNQNDPTFSTTISVTGSGERNVRLRVKGDNPAATASTG